jgi:conserved domain protein
MKKDIFHYALSAFVVGGMALSFASCSDNDLAANQGGSNDALVRFSVNDVQSEAIARGAAMTRGAITPGLGNNDLAGQKLAAHSNRNLNVCFIETAVEGVNPVKADAHTRAEIETTISGDFSSTGIRGVAATSILTTPEWFKAAKTKSNGELYTPIRWSIFQPWARFYAVYPSKDSYSKLTINDMTSADNAPSVDFTVEPNVRDQKDFMTACTGNVNYAKQFEQPTTSLDFRHALTAIRFAVGQNLSWSKVIDKVEIRNAIMKSKYKLSSEFSGTGAAWDNTGATRGTATLSGLSVSTSQNPNATIMGNTGDNFTFYMIPQELTGNGVVAYVHFTDNTEITATLKGEWKAGTTRTLKLSQTTSTWQYTLTATDPSRAANYNETASQAYGITSFREDPATHVKQPVAWKVVGYSVDGGTTYTPNKPAWLTALSVESGNGGTAAETGTATLKISGMEDMLAKRNKGLSEAEALGTSSTPYDLSIHDRNGNVVNRSTANCYVISAPGYYRIPLVYGNAIENGNVNPSSYKTSNTGTYILSNFKDHLGNDIDNPWIEKTNGGANTGVDGAKIVWADEANLVHLATGSAAISHDAGNAYLNFEVKAADIKSGNAVVAVTKGGTVVWSWHLWFAPKSALNTIEVTNHQGVKYNFTAENLGWKPASWTRTSYDKPRIVKLKVEQTIANGGTSQSAVINITQNPNDIRQGTNTFYEFGRKDAFPGTDNLAPGSTFYGAGNQMSIINGIQNPQAFYNSPWGQSTSWYSAPPAGYSYVNTWSTDNTIGGWTDNTVIKTIYDPCPVGFKMPASNAFSGFTRTGGTAAGTDVNADDVTDSQKFTDNMGHNFWTNSSHTATIHFPASGQRFIFDGSLKYVGSRGYCWSAIPLNAGNGMYFDFFFSYVNWGSSYTKSYGFSVRPVSE